LLACSLRTGRKQRSWSTASDRPGNRGKEIWYETDESRVRFQRQPDGRFALTITARGSGVAVTIAVGNRNAM
jgi:hypothetical protein